MHRVTIAYGFKNISQILSGCLNAIVACTTDISIATRLDRRDAIGSYIYCTIYCVTGLVIIAQMQAYIVPSLLPDISPYMSDVLDFSLQLIGLIYMIVTSAIPAVLMFKRELLIDFLLTDCSQTQIDMKYQRTISENLMVISVVIGSFAEPIIYYACCSQYFLSGPTYYSLPFYVRCIIQAQLSWAIWLMGLPLMASMYAVPVMKAFLSCALAERVEQAIGELVVPFTQATLAFEHHEPRFACRLRPDPATRDKLTSTIVDSLELVKLDWPAMPNNEFNSDLSERLGTGRADELERRTAINRNCPDVISLQAMQYRRLIKMIVDIRSTLMKFEGIVRYMHASTMCLSTLGLSQYIVLCVMRVRLDANRDDVIISWQTLSMFVCTAFAVFNSTVINLVQFMYLNRLPRQLERLKHELYKMNQKMLPPYASHKDSWTKFKTHGDGERARYHAELSHHAWDLYDVLSRLSAQANMKLLGDARYSKRLLLSIIGQQISFCILYAQFIDVYFVIRSFEENQ